MNICPNCGRKYYCPPAMSRTDNKTEICPICGNLEAFQAAGISPPEEIIEQIVEAERAAGRIE